MTGSGDLVSVTIAPSAVDPDDLETLQDLVVAAVRDAKRAADELAASTMGPLAGGWPAAVSACPASDRPTRRGTPCTRAPSRT